METTEYDFADMVAQVVVTICSIKKLPSETIFQLCENTYRKRYSNINLVEFREAFVLNLLGEYEGGKVIDHFQSFDLPFMTAVLNAYLKRRAKAMIELVKTEIIEDYKMEDKEIKAMELKILSAITKDIEAFNFLKAEDPNKTTKQEIDSSSYKFKLIEMKLLVSVPLQKRFEIWESAKEEIKREVSTKMKFDFMNKNLVKEYIENRFEKENDGAFRVRSHYKALLWLFENKQSEIMQGINEIITHKST